VEGATADLSSFDITMPAQRVVFAAGAIDRAPDILGSLDRDRPLLIASASAKELADDLARRLGPALAGRVHEVVQHVPDSNADSATAQAREGRADSVVTVGGGSATGLGKAVAVALDVPLIAVPTTYAGSEMTAVYGITGQHKVTGRDDRALPRAVIYDPLLTTTMPAHTTAASGLNAVAHCVEAVYAPSRSPLTSLVAEEGAGLLATALRQAVREPEDLDARTSALYGAFLGGWVMNIAGTSIHHTMCHAVGGTYRLSHADTHAVLLPHVVAFVEAAVPERLCGIAEALGADTAAAGLSTLAADVGAPTSLAAIGMPESGLDEAARRAAAAVADKSPRPVDAQSLRRLLGDAYAGRAPGSFDSS
jgi:alcohol dehydrogenase class IV